MPPTRSVSTRNKKKFRDIVGPVVKKCGNCHFQIVILKRMATKLTKIYNALLVAVAVVFCVIVKVLGRLSK